MDIITKDIICSEEVLTLTNQRAVFWEREEMLIISDLHVGKAAHFRKNGIPMSTEILNKDLKRLAFLLSFFKAKSLMVVGDLFHANMNAELDVFRNWLNSLGAIKLILVKGNHDRISASIAELFKDWEISNTLFIQPFKFIHDGDDDELSAFRIAGHTHPGVLIKGKGKQKLRLPCYQVSKNQLTLPAFSLFTGLNTTPPKEKIVNYAFTDEDIFEII
jgi:DNA ligase-associated metallophosphoesterase